MNRTKLAEFLWQNEGGGEEGGRVLLGNGASELIDLVIRDSKTTYGDGTWSPGMWGTTQYKEYERSARNSGRTIVDTSNASEKDRQKASLVCIVNPNNPTGDYLGVKKLKEWIEDSTCDGGTVLVDESMQLWLGENWRSDSLVSQSEWIRKMRHERKISIWVVHSWTKIWSCTGLRLGSIIAPAEEDIRRIKSIQVPWSVNMMALSFLEEVVRDGEFLRETWSKTPVWRKYTEDKIREHRPDWKVYGEKFLSWLWIDTGSEEAAEASVRLAKEKGVPIRWGKHGYDRPTFIRVAVRAPHLTDILLSSWKS